jgi:hypothetical protein
VGLRLRNLAGLQGGLCNERRAGGHHSEMQRPQICPQQSSERHHGVHDFERYATSIRRTDLHSDLARPCNLPPRSILSEANSSPMLMQTIISYISFLILYNVETKDNALLRSPQSLRLSSISYFTRTLQRADLNTAYTGRRGVGSKNTLIFIWMC